MKGLRMTPPVAYVAPNEITSPLFCEAFAQGCGGRVNRRMDLDDGDVALFGSPQLWRLLQQAQREGRTWYYADHAFFDRHRRYRIVRNDYQPDGRGGGDPAKFRLYRRPVKDWRRSGRHILVCPQSTTYFRLFGLDVDAWLQSVTRTLAERTDRPIRIRWKMDALTRPIADDLKDCWAVVVYSSAAAIDALIAGVPVFVLAEFASAYRMGTPDLRRIERPEYPGDRESFLWALANQEWTLAEIREGVAWRALTK